MTFDELLKKTGVSTRGASYLLGVRYDTVRNWKYGKCSVPDGVMRDMQEYAKQAKLIFERD